MRALVVLAVVWVAASMSAATPASLAGKVYRETTAIPSIRQSWERTIVFGDDGRFTSLLYGAGYALTLAAPYKIFLSPPPADGRYTYTRTSDTTASVGLSFDDGTESTLVIPADVTGTSNGTVVQLTDSLAAAPVNNVSLRGHVAPGRPLIAGFVLPGPTVASDQFLPPAGTVRREVLIRVVGPGLAQFGVSDGWADPDFVLFTAGKPANVNEVKYGDWDVAPFGSGAPSVGLQAAFQKIFRAVGAFPLTPGSRDAAAIVRLDPGAYTVVCTAPTGDPGGDAMIEVYFLP